MSARRILTTLALMLAGTITTPPANARDVFFAGSAVSNVTLDFAGNCLTNQCPLARLGCRVILFNPAVSGIAGGPSGSTSQNVTVSMDLTLEAPGQNVFTNPATNNFRQLAGNPYQASNGTTLTNSVVIASGTATDQPRTLLAGDVGAAPTAVAAGSYVLNTGRFYVYERTWDISYTYSNSGGAKPVVTGFDPYYAFSKIYGLCSGYITVTDAGGGPGFILAGGSMDYIADSYMNPVIMYGGFLNNLNQLGYGAPLKLTAYLRLVSRGGATAVIPNVQMATYARTDYNFYDYAECNAKYQIDNTLQNSTVQNFSASFPKHIANMGFAINGGAPF